MSLVAHAQVPDYVPTEGLVAWYPFNGNANDESGNAFHGEINGALLTADRFLEPNSAYSFSGNCQDRIDMLVPEMTENTSFSVSFWAKRNGTGCYNPRMWEFYGGSRTTQCGWFNDWDSITFSGFPIVGANLENEIWYHFALTNTGDTWEAYFNGEFNNLKVDSTVINSPDLAIGRMNHPAWDSFNGEIDDFAIWNRALSAEEVLALYNAQLPVQGCTDSTACNFDAEATSDDGSCIPSGCMDSEACNYNALAECAGEACDYTCCPGPGCCLEGTVWDAELGGCIPIEATCPEDLDFDGVVGVNDLMELLSAFGTDCAPAEEPETTEFTCGDPVNYHGYDYATVQIGEQCWFAENLRSGQYTNGDSIPGNLTSSQWTSTNEGAQAVYANDEGNLELYGRLYNGYAMNDTRALCPLNWHIPSDEDWGELELELGLDDGELLLIGERGDDQGAQLKASPSDSPSWDGSNTVGFHAVANGYRHNHGYYQHLNFNSHYWSKTASEEGIFYIRTLQSSVEGVIRLTRVANSGYTVRCLKD